MKTIMKAAVMAAVMVLMTAPAAVRAGDDAGDWQKAQMKGDVAAYDLYLAEHPSGAHASDALSQAVSKSAAGLGSAAKSCGSNFPIMAYYASASRAGAKVGNDALAAAFAAGKNCGFTSGLSVAEKGRAEFGLSEVRKKLAPQASSGPLTKGVLDLDLVLVALQDSLLIDLSDEIYKCKVGKDPFRDPKKAEVHACSQPIRETQSKICANLAEQVKSDFSMIGSVSDREYRMDFWERYRKIAKKEVIQEVASYYKLYEEAERAKAGESDPAIQKKIGEVATLLAGAGKPLGGGW